MPHPGYSLAPHTETRVRMARERVDIRIAERPDRRNYTHLADISAVFEMINPSADPETLDVGFPIEAFFLAHNEWAVEEITTGDPGFPPDAFEIMGREAAAKLHADGYYDLLVSVDGGTAFAPKFIGRRGALAEPHGSEYIWYHWKMAFAPGTTSVAVTYCVPSVYSYARAYQNVGYVLYSGSFWSETIGAAVVSVSFPEPAVDVELGPRTTPGYRQAGAVVTWTYEDIEPGPMDNINVEFLPPDAARAKRDLRDHLGVHPNDADAMVELARVYLDIAGRGPETGPYPDFPRMAEPLLRRALEIDPSHCVAWNVYLLNYHRMHGETFGLDFYQRYELSNDQCDLAARAVAHCPDDPGIRAWHDIATPDAWDLPDTLGFLETSSTRPRLGIRNPMGGFSGCELPDDGPAIVESCYRLQYVRDSRRFLYVRREDFTDEQRQAMVTLLTGCRYFARVGAARVRQYYRTLETTNPISIKRPSGDPTR